LIKTGAFEQLRTHQPLLHCV